MISVLTVRIVVASYVW